MLLCPITTTEWIPKARITRLFTKGLGKCLSAGLGATALPSKPKDNSRRKSRVVLRMAPEIGHQVVALNDAPVNAFDQFRIDTCPDRHRKRRIPESCRTEMRTTKKYVRKRRNARRKRDLRAEQIRVHRSPNSTYGAIVPVEIRYSAQPVGELVLAGKLPTVQVRGR